MSLPLAITITEIEGFPCRRGKVRDVYDLGDRLVIVTTDRISAFDWVLADGVPDKGKILTQLTLFWMNLLKVENHLISTDLNEMGPAFSSKKSILEGRTILVKKNRGCTDRVCGSGLACWLRLEGIPIIFNRMWYQAARRFKAKFKIA